jgi:hypothetical protein
VTYAPAMTTILDVLRGDPLTRPLCDESVADTLRGQLDELAAGLESGLVVRTPRGDSVNIAPTTGRVRGMLVHQLVRLAAAGYDWRNPAVDALVAWRANAPAELVAEVARFDADERAQLRADLDAHAVVLRRALGTLAPGWLARSAVRARLVLAGGRLTLVDVIDLMVGVVGPRASVALVDVTSSPLGADAEDRVAYHALCQTLRTSHAPLTSALVSTATGDVLYRSVDDDLLARAVRYVRGAVESS